MKRIITSSMLALGFLMMGAKCTSTKTLDDITKPKTPVAATVLESSKNIEKKNEEIKAEAIKIDESSKTIAQSAETIKKNSDDPTIVKEATNISEQSNLIENSVIEIKNDAESISQELNVEKIEPVITQIVELEKSDSEWKNKYEDLLAASTAEMQKIIRVFWIVGFAMIVAGMIIAYFHRIIGGIILCAGFVSVGLAAANQYYYQEIATVGLWVFIIGFLTSAVSVGYFIFKNKKAEEAVEDNVKLLEDIKTEVPEEVKNKIFGDEGIAKKIQRESTKKMVSTIRAKIVK
jgi:uncharacterized membrane protein